LPISNPNPQNPGPSEPGTLRTRNPQKSRPGSQSREAAEEGPVPEPDRLDEEEPAGAGCAAGGWLVVPAGGTGVSARSFGSEAAPPLALSARTCPSRSWARIWSTCLVRSADR